LRQHHACTFFPPRPPTPPALPSFPTRRSSDLRKNQHPASPRARISRSAGCALAAVLLLCERGRPAWQRESALLRNQRKVTALTRSEEHTSELQSLAYLVCRLLLEKKKLK